MAKGKNKPERAATPAGDEAQDALQTSRQVYEEVKGQYHIHDSANVNLEKKAQSYMVASALVAALLATPAVTYVGGLVWDPLVSYLAVASVIGMLLTIALCTIANRALPHPVTIVGGRLLCHNELDEKTYAELIKSEEGFYKSRIEEYARALVKLEEANKKKANLLKIAQPAFALSVALAIIGFVAAIIL